MVWVSLQLRNVGKGLGNGHWKVGRTGDNGQQKLETAAAGVWLRAVSRKAFEGYNEEDEEEQWERKMRREAGRQRRRPLAGG